MYIDVLGTKYHIATKKISEDEYMQENDCIGHCGEIRKEIVIADFYDKDYFNYLDGSEAERLKKVTLRHEIMHAFLNESGLSSSSNISPAAWAKNEEMIDWFAIQSPKIFKAFQEAGCI